MRKKLSEWLKNRKTQADIDEGMKLLSREHPGRPDQATRGAIAAIEIFNRILTHSDLPNSFKAQCHIGLGQAHLAQARLVASDSPEKPRLLALAKTDFNTAIEVTMEDEAPAPVSPSAAEAPAGYEMLSGGESAREASPPPGEAEEKIDDPIPLAQSHEGLGLIALASGNEEEAYRQFSIAMYWCKKSMSKTTDVFARCNETRGMGEFTLNPSDAQLKFEEARYAYIAAEPLTKKHPLHVAEEAIRCGRWEAAAAALSAALASTPELHCSLEYQTRDGERLLVPKKDASRTAADFLTKAERKERYATTQAHLTHCYKLLEDIPCPPHLLKLKEGCEKNVKYRLFNSYREDAETHMYIHDYAEAVRAYDGVLALLSDPADKDLRTEYLQLRNQAETLRQADPDTTKAAALSWIERGLSTAKLVLGVHPKEGAQQPLLGARSNPTLELPRRGSAVEEKGDSTHPTAV